MHRQARPYNDSLNLDSVIMGSVRGALQLEHLTMELCSYRNRTESCRLTLRPRASFSAKLIYLPPSSLMRTRNGSFWFPVGMINCSLWTSAL